MARVIREADPDAFILPGRRLISNRDQLPPEDQLAAAPLLLRRFCRLRGVHPRLTYAGQRAAERQNQQSPQRQTSHGHIH